MSSEAYDQDQPLAPELVRLEEQFELIEEEILALTEDLSDRQLTWKPSEKRWSIAECLDHLNVTGFELLPLVDRAVADGRRRGLKRTRPLKLRWRGRLAVRFMEPPPRMKAKAPGLFQPRWPEQPRQVVRELVELQGELIKRLHEANGLDLAAMIIASPAARWMKLSLGEWLSATAAHQRRHLWQARRILKLAGFPGSLVAE